MKLTKLLPIIGIILFIYIISQSDIPTILTTFSNINPFYFSISVLTLIPIVIIKAVKWHILAKPFRVNLPINRSLTGWIVGYSLGLVTPGKVGDLVRAYYMKDHASLGKSLSTVIIDRVMDVLILFIFALGGIVTFLNILPGQSAVLQTITLIFIGFIILFILATKRNVVRFILKVFFKRLIPERHRSNLSMTFHELYDGFSEIRKSKSVIFWSILLAILSWIIAIFQYWMFALALNINTFTFFHLLWIMPIVLLIELIPISILGLGTRDAALIFFFGMLALTAELAISFSLLFFLVDYVFLGLIGYIMWFRKPVKIELQ